MFSLFKKLQSKLPNKSGQHLIEYTIVLVLVIAGIVTMGPHVIRSWNAQMKGWDDSVKDSFLEDTTTPPGIDFPIDTCSCTYTAPCSNPPCCGFDTCTSREASLVELCNPINCQPAGPTQCTVDSGCCDTIPSAPIVCGANATQVPAGALNAAPGGGCLDGYKQMEKTCGASTAPQYECSAVQDSACLFKCTADPIVLPNGASYCRDIESPSDDERSLTEDTPYTYVSSCTTNKCEIQTTFFTTVSTPGACSNPSANGLAGGALGDFAQCPRGMDVVGGGLDTSNGYTTQNSIYGSTTILPKCTSGPTANNKINWLINNPVKTNVSGQSVSGWMCGADNYAPDCVARCGAMNLLPASSLNNIVEVWSGGYCAATTVAYCPGNNYRVIGGGYSSGHLVGGNASGFTNSCVWGRDNQYRWITSLPEIPSLVPGCINTLDTSVPNRNCNIKDPNGVEGWRCGVGFHNMRCLAVCVPIP